MKKITLSMFALFLSSVAFSQTAELKTVSKQETQKQSELKWDTESHDFGALTQGKPATFEFAFTNTTPETVYISEVKPTCGCTAANYTKTAIKPGEKGTVAATFNAASVGAFTKSITVTTSDSALPKALVIKGQVNANAVVSK